jgi:hypothetical protein
MELLLEVPGNGSSSPSVQWDRTWLRTDFLVVVLTESREDCQMSWSISPWSPSWVKTAQRVGSQEQRKTWNTIRWLATSFGPVSLCTLIQPTLQPLAQWASQLVSHWGVQMLWKHSQTRNQATLRGVENSDFIFMPVGSDVCTCVWALNKGFKGYLKSSTDHQVISNVLSYQLGASSGLETKGLDKNSRGVLLWKVYLQMETKECGNECLSLHGALYLNPELFAWL